jgi:hypothetical protein
MMARAFIGIFTIPFRLLFLIGKIVFDQIVRSLVTAVIFLGGGYAVLRLMGAWG